MRGLCPCPSLERCSQDLVEVFLEQRRPCAPSGSPLVERRMASVVLFQLSPATPPSAGDPLLPPPSLEKHLFSPTHPDPCLPLSPPAGDLLQLCYTLELLEFSASFPSPGNKRYLVESVSEYLALLRLVVNTRPSQALAALTKHLQTAISVYTECILEFQFYDEVGLQAFTHTFVEDFFLRFQNHSPEALSMRHLARMSSTVVAVHIKDLLQVFDANTPLTTFLHDGLSDRADAGALAAPLSNNCQPLCHLVDPSCFQALK